jgi:hypothetical protein
MMWKMGEKENVKHNGMAIIICFRVSGELLLLRFVRNCVERTQSSMKQWWLLRRFYSFILRALHELVMSQSHHCFCLMNTREAR